MLTPDQCRAFDQYLINQRGVAGTILMENAGRGCAQLILKLHKESTPNETLRATILCGSGNNGGDGFVIARHLINAGAAVKVLLFAPAEKYTGDAKTMLDYLEPLRLQPVRWDAQQTDAQAEATIGTVGGQPCHWCVDGLLGTGTRGPLRPVMAQAVVVANRLKLRRLAVDIPTGLDPVSGQPDEPAFQADYCATFVDLKTGFQNPLAERYLGQVSVIDIGFTPKSCVWDPPAV